MLTGGKLPENIFLFNETNKGFITGESRQLGGQDAVQRTIKYTAIFYISLALPVGTLFALLFAALLRQPFVPLFIWQAVLMLLFSAYFGRVSYRLRRKLELSGKGSGGEVDHYDTRMSFGTFGYRKVPRLKYRFQSPSGHTVAGHTLIPPLPDGLLPDGRTLPVPGTPVAVLYVDDKQHTVL